MSLSIEVKAGIIMLLPYNRLRNYVRTVDFNKASILNKLDLINENKFYWASGAKRELAID